MSGETTPSDKLQQLRARVDSAATPAERVEATLQLAEALWLSDPVAAKPLLEQVLAEADAAGRPNDGGRAAYMLGAMLRRAGDLDGAARYAEIVFNVAEATGDRRVRASWLNLTGIIHEERGEIQSALECFEEYLEITRQIGSGQGERMALNQLACAHAHRGDLGKALECYRQCLDANTKAGDAHGRATSLYNIGWTLSAMGHWTEATESFYRAMALCEEHGFNDPLASTRLALGELALKRSEYDDAAFMFRAVVEAERESRRAGGTYSEALSNLGWTYFRKGDLAQAEENLDEAALMSEAAEDRSVLAILCCRRAEVALARGRLDAAGGLLAEGMGHVTRLKRTREQGEILRVQALLSAARGDTAKALKLFSRSEAVLAPLGDTYELALARLQHGRELLDMNRPDEARPLLQTAVQTFRRLAVVAEAEEAAMLLYRLEASTDRHAALLEGLFSITALGLAPEKCIEQSLAMLCDNLRFEQGAVLVGGRPVTLRGRPDPADLPRSDSTLSQTGLVLLLPVRQGRRLLGTVWLRRAKPARTRLEPGLLKLISRALAPSLAKLVDLETIETGRTMRIPGLRFRGVVGCNREVLDLLALIPRVADAGVPVLVRGESGSGKELIARALHESGPRADHPFVTVNCAAVPESLLEAEFFGVEAGAATGVAARLGKFELAQNGTVFLDEIGDMSPALQAKLLRVIEDKTVMRVGGNQAQKVDVRIVAATNMDLDRRERQGLFRRDLLYRLNTVQLILPPLRRRKEDLPVLTEYFIARAAQEYNRPVRLASEEVLASFAVFSWPGNIRQLQHVVERAVILATGDTLHVHDLPLELRPRRSGPASAGSALTRAEQRRATDENERATLLDALNRTSGNVLEAARLSGYSRAQFYRLLRKHHIKN